MQTVHIIASIIQLPIAILLILIIAIQQTKNEGLGAAISGKVSSSFKGKAGFDERMTGLTTRFAVAFFVISIVVAVTMNR